MPPIRTATFRKASPALLFKSYRQSKVPEGGWTQESFYTENGVRLVQDWVKMNRSATTKNARMLARTLKALIEKILYEIADRMEGIAELSEKKHPHTYQRKTTVLSGVWGNIINEVLHDFSGDVQEAVQPYMQSTADDVVDKGRQLLGSTVNRTDTTTINNSVRQAAREITSVPNTIRDRINRIIQREHDKGSSVFDTIAAVRRQTPSLAAGRIATIVRTELGRAADIANIQAAMEGTCTHMSVIGCETIERTYTYRGLPTCNIQNVPINECMNVRFHPNHTGCWVPSAFRQSDGSTPELDPRSNSGHGTFEEQRENPEGDSAPFLNPRPAPGPEMENPVTLAPTPEPPPAPIDILPQGSLSPVLPTTPENCGAPVIGRPLPSGKPPKNVLDFDTLPATYQDTEEVRNAVKVIRNHASSATRFNANDEDIYNFFRTVEVLPDAMESLLLQDIPINLADTTELVIRAGRTFDCIGSIGGKQSFLYRRTICVDEQGKLYIHHNSFELWAQYQGNGYARKLLQNQINFYDAIGAEYITLAANIDVGAYAWARYGFYLTDSGAEMLTRQLKRNWNRIITKDLAPANPSDREAFDASVVRLERIVNKDPMDSKDLWAIASEQVKVRTPGGQERKLGYHVLTGTFYDAQLDLNNPEQYARLVSYISHNPTITKGRELYSLVDGHQQDAMLHAEFLSSVWGNFRADFAGVEQAIRSGCPEDEALWLYASPESVALMAPQLPQELYTRYLALLNR